MKLLPATALLLITACAPGAADEGTQQPAAGSTPATGQCNATPAQFAVGETYDAAVAERARTAAGAATVRRLVPGQVVTMEFNGTRLNLDTDAAGRITAARCG